MNIPVAQAHPLPGAHLVAPDLLGLRIAIVNVFFIGMPGDGARWVLVDAGVGDCSELIVRAAEARFGRGARPLAIILTHGHFDHVGAVRALAEGWDVPVYAHARELPYLTGQRSYPPADPLAGDGAMAWLAPLYPRGPIDLGGRVQALPADGRVPHLPGWRAVATPGHSPGHISLYRPDDRVLIAGDAVITTNQESALSVLAQAPALRRPPAYFTPDWPAARSSLAELAALQPAVVTSGHGPTLRGPAMEAQLATLARRFDELGLPRRGRYPTRARAQLGDAPPPGRWATAVRGAGAGLTATAPMTLALLALGALRARDREEPFPPRQVTAGVTSRLGLWQRASAPQRAGLTLALHLGYGAMVGAGYGARGPAASLPPALDGAAYGLLVWAASYAGWLPAAGIVRPPWRERRGRTLQLVAAHLVWGMSLAWLMRRR